MKIGVVGTTAKPISVNSSGGTEVFCALLCQGLAKLGHDVFLFATKATSLQGVNVVPSADYTMSQINEMYKSENQKELTPEQKKLIDTGLTARTLIKAYTMQDEFDILHDNSSSYLTGSISDMFSVPLVTTMHMPPTSFGDYMNIPMLITQPKNTYVAVSEFEQKHSQIKSELIYNGIDVGSYPFDLNGGTDLIWIGRIRPDTPKGLKEAIQASLKTNSALTFAGSISNQEYYDSEIAPLITNSIHSKGVISTEEKNKFLSDARAALFPITWEEPFGFVFVEAMACGTPIIAYARGSIPEIIKDGVTGFIVNSSEDNIRGNWIIKKTGIEGLCEAIEKMKNMSSENYKAMRAASRKHVEENFTVDKMVNGYESLYRRILRQGES